MKCLETTNLSSLLDLEGNSKIPKENEEGKIKKKRKEEK
jgi:hypothetical protein